MFCSVKSIAMVFVLVAALGCGRDMEQPHRAGVLEGARFALEFRVRTVDVPWGGEESRLGRVPSGPEQVARGPQSLALTANGDLAILDAVKGRVAFFAPGGEYRGAVETDAMAVDFSIAPDGEIASLNLAAMKIELRDGSGAVSATLALSPAFKTVVALDHAGGAGLELATMHQESYLAEAAQPLATVREGLRGADASFKSVTLGVSAIAGQRLLVVREALEPLLKGGGEATRIVASFPTECSAVRLLGVLAEGELALVCDVASELDGRIDVERRIQVLAPGGDVLYELPVSTAADYSPFRAYRVSNGALLAMEPGVLGLRVTILGLARGGAK